MKGIRFALFTFIAAVSAVSGNHAATLARFTTSLGTIDAELFDDDKPVTVSNFIKYATSGRYLNQFIHRWEPGFVIQGGGFRVETIGGLHIPPVQTFAPITNEYNVGRKFSNTFGTIAMARQPGITNSATSQWFFNLKDNSFLDGVDGGFTVFGRVTSGTNVLNLFIPPPPAAGIFLDRTVFPALPVLSTNLTYNDLIYVSIELRRDLGLAIGLRADGAKRIQWHSVAGVTNIIEHATEPAGVTWSALTNLLGTGGTMEVIDLTTDPKRTYRARLAY